MCNPRKWAVAGLAALLVASLLTVVQVAAPPEAEASGPAPALPGAGYAGNGTDCRYTATGQPAPGPVPAPPVQNFTPSDGNLGLNNPLGDRNAKRVNTQAILNAINSVPTCGVIQLATWNFRSRETFNAMKAAMARGVTVRIVMSSFNNAPRGTEYHNPLWLEMVDFINVQSNTATTPPERMNWATQCARACRYNNGAAHSKYYLFSSVGAARNVVMYGSHNLTDVAAYNQWNDLVTTTRPRFYQTMQQVFTESQPKRNQVNPYRRVAEGDMTMDVYPYVGAGRPSSADPMMTVLNRVRCTNAGRVGVRGRTAIRVNVSAILYSRGQQLTNKLVQLRRQGCDIRVLTTNVGFHSMKAMQRARIPLRQLARYDDRNRRYTHFTHTKYITVNGNYAGRANQQIVWNGSANWTNSTLLGDEMLGEWRRPAMVNAYNRYVNRWFRDTPMRGRVVPTTNLENERRTNDPWRLLERDF